MKKIFEWFGGSVLKDLLGGLDKLFTSKEDVKFLAPIFGFTIPILEIEFWELLKIGIGGYVVGRSAEKISKNITISKK